MRFTKMHGLGNDYVYVDSFREHVQEAPALARVMSDHHFGIGSDGLILIGPSTVADVRMEMYNADGSRGKMCGNGIRCVAKYAYEHGLSRSNPMRVETDSGVKELYLTLEAGRVKWVRVDMGEPILRPDQIPVRWPEASCEALVGVSASRYIPIQGPAAWMEDCGWHDAMSCVSMGNPHLIIFVAYVESVPLATLGPFFENQPIFPQRINVHFVTVHSRSEATMRTWERGSGATLACGTGACAVLVAGVLNQYLDRKATLHLPGGDLWIEWAENNHVFKTGPATEVFSGEWHEI